MFSNRIKVLNEKQNITVFVSRMKIVALYL